MNLAFWRVNVSVKKQMDKVAYFVIRTCDLMSFMELFNKLQGGLNLLFCQQ